MHLFSGFKAEWKTLAVYLDAAFSKDHRHDYYSAGLFLQFFDYLYVRVGEGI